MLIDHLLVLAKAEWVLFFDLVVEARELLALPLLALIHFLVDLALLFLEVLDRQFSVLLHRVLLLELHVFFAVFSLDYRHLDVLRLDYPRCFSIA